MIYWLSDRGLSDIISLSSAHQKHPFSVTIGFAQMWKWVAAKAVKTRGRTRSWPRGDDYSLPQKQSREVEQSYTRKKNKAAVSAKSHSPSNDNQGDCPWCLSKGRSRVDLFILHHPWCLHFDSESFCSVHWFCLDLFHAQVFSLNPTKNIIPISDHTSSFKLDEEMALPSSQTFLCFLLLLTNPPHYFQR